MRNIVCTNRKAFFDYFIIDRFESGIVLRGSEVKALRARKANIKDSFVRIIRGEAFLFNAHISHLDTTNTYFKPQPNAPRKLLLHKKEIRKLFSMVSQKTYTIVPLSLYFNEKNILKVEIALVQGKKLHDKRESIKRKMLDREAQAAIKNKMR